MSMTYLVGCTLTSFFSAHQCSSDRSQLAFVHLSTPACAVFVTFVTMPRPAMLAGIPTVHGRRFIPVAAGGDDWLTAWIKIKIARHLPNPRYSEEDFIKSIVEFLNLHEVRHPIELSEVGLDVVDTVGLPLRMRLALSMLVHEAEIWIVRADGGPSLSQLLDAGDFPARRPRA